MNLYTEWQIIIMERVKNTLVSSQKRSALAVKSLKMDYATLCKVQRKDYFAKDK